MVDLKFRITSLIRLKRDVGKTRFWNHLYFMLLLYIANTVGHVYFVQVLVNYTSARKCNIIFLRRCSRAKTNRKFRVTVILANQAAHETKSVIYNKIKCTTRVIKTFQTNALNNRYTAIYTHMRTYAYTRDFVFHSYQQNAVIIYNNSVLNF